MKIILLYNSAYISYRYNFDIKLLRKFEFTIFPDLVKQLSSERSVGTLEDLEYMRNQSQALFYI